MDVLGDVFVRIEGVNRAWQQQYTGETKAQRRRNRGRGPVKATRKWSARSHFSHSRERRQTTWPANGSKEPRRHTKEEILRCDGASRVRPNLTFSGACMSVILSTSLQRNGLCFGSDQNNNGSRGYLIERLLQR